jgi:hypothetical protein
MLIKVLRNFFFKIVKSADNLVFIEMSEKWVITFVNIREHVATYGLETKNELRVVSSCEKYLQDRLFPVFLLTITLVVLCRTAVFLLNSTRILRYKYLFKTLLIASPGLRILSDKIDKNFTAYSSLI